MSIGGISISTSVAARILAIASNAVHTGETTAIALGLSNKPWTPPQWSKQKALYSIVIQNTNSLSAVQPLGDGGFVLQANANSTTMFVFDAMLVANHDISATSTDKPLQTGINLSDHVFLNNRYVTLEVGMSDAMASYQTGMWQGNTSKSVSAFQAMVKLQEERAFLTINTRLQTYKNCVLINIRSVDNSKTFHGASMILTFKQLFLFDVANQFNSARPNTTASTQLGTVQAAPPDTTVLNQHEVTNIGLPGQGIVPGSGNFSSNNLTGVTP